MLGVLGRGRFVPLALVGGCPCLSPGSLAVVVGGWGWILCPYKMGGGGDGRVSCTSPGDPSALCGGADSQVCVPISPGVCVTPMAESWMSPHVPRGPWAGGHKPATFEEWGRSLVWDGWLEGPSLPGVSLLPLQWSPRVPTCPGKVWGGEWALWRPPTGSC